MNEERIFHYTVSELIEILRSFPPEIPILTSGYENGFENIQQPILQSLEYIPDIPDYDGEFQPAGEDDSEVFQAVILRRVERNGEIPPQLGTWSQDN